MAIASCSRKLTFAANDLIADQMWNKAKVCPDCNKPCALTLAKCNGCGSTALANAPVSATENVLMGFVYGVSGTRGEPGCLYRVWRPFDPAGGEGLKLGNRWGCKYNMRVCFCGKHFPHGKWCQLPCS